MFGQEEFTMTEMHSRGSKTIEIFQDLLVSLLAVNHYSLETAFAEDFESWASWMYQLLPVIH